MSSESLNLNSFFSLLENENIHENIRLLLKYIISRRFNVTTNVSKKQIEKIFTTTSMYKAFRNLNLKRVNTIYYSEHYVILEICYTYTRKCHYTETEVKVESTYLIGVDSERDTLFIEKLPRHHTLPSQYVSVYNVNGLTVLRTEDKIIQREVIGYDIDMDLDDFLSEKTIINKRVRVQGDLCVTVTTFVRAYEDELLGGIASQVERYFSREIIRRIRDILEMYGLNVESDINALIVYGIKKDMPFNKRIEIMKVIGYLIYRDLDIRDMLKELGHEDLKKDLLLVRSTWSWTDEAKVIVSYASPNSRMIEIIIEEHKSIGFGGENYDFIEINLRFDRDIFFAKALEILGDLKRENALDFRDAKITCGRHLILCRTKPINISFEYKLFGENRRFEIRGLPIITKGELTIVHPQHNVKKLWFSKEVMVEPFIIENDRVFLRRLNKYTFEELVKKYLTQANKTLGVGNE